MPEQLECRIVITRLKNNKIKIGMFSPCDSRYEPFGHGAGEEMDDKEAEKTIAHVKELIEKAGHRLTFCERSE